MFRYILLLCLLSLGDCRRNWCKDHPDSCHRHDWDMNEHPDIFFNTLSGIIRDADRKALRFCNAQNVTTTEEVYTNDGYKLMIPLTGFNEDMVTIKIMNRVIFVEVKEPQENGKRFAEVRILPENSAFDRATWNLKEGTLEISVPYKVPLGTNVKINCDYDSHNFETPAIVVPKA